MTVSALALAALSGCGLGASQTSPAETGSAAPTSSSSTQATEPTQTPEPSATAEHPVAKLLATLKVKGRAPMTGYGRDRFGQAWLDADRNGCDTRNDVLGEYLTDNVFKPGTRDCVVYSGTLDDPYTGTLIDFVYGDGTLVDIDHVERPSIAAKDAGTSAVVRPIGQTRDPRRRRSIAGPPARPTPRARGATPSRSTSSPGRP